MLFNSYLFLLAFLPVTLAVYYAVGAGSLKAAALWLCLTSIVFYGWWNPQFVALLLGSIAFNYIVSQAILSLPGRPRLQLAVTAFGVTADLLLLFHYKYFATLVNFLHDFGLGGTPMDALILPFELTPESWTLIQPSGFLHGEVQGAVQAKGGAGVSEGY